MNSDLPGLLSVDPIDLLHLPEVTVVAFTGGVVLNTTRRMRWLQLHFVDASKFSEQAPEHILKMHI